MSGPNDCTVQGYSTTVGTHTLLATATDQAGNMGSAFVSQLVRAGHQVSVTARNGAKAAQVALAWLLAQPTILAPIASATSVEQLKALMAAPALNLGADHLKTLTEASAYCP